LIKLLARLLFIIPAAIIIILWSLPCHAQVTDTSSIHQTQRKDSPAPRNRAADTGRLSAGVMANAGTITADSVKPQPFQPNPKKAGMYSAILPGLGQLYNRQYWKVPVIYAGVGIAAYFIITDLKNYQTYRKAYIGRINNPYPTDQYVIWSNGQIVGYIYTEDQLQQLQNDYNKYLDLSVMFTGIGFALQVVDAITSAHLKNFDISRDISMQMKPVVFPNGVGLGLVMNFK
jgi:hypothetical protein